MYIYMTCNTKGTFLITVHFGKNNFKLCNGITLKITEKCVQFLFSFMETTACDISDDLKKDDIKKWHEMIGK